MSEDRNAIPGCNAAADRLEQSDEFCRQMQIGRRIMRRYEGPLRILAGVGADEKANPRPAWRPTHPGVLLREEFLMPMGLAPEALARDIGISAEHLGGILSGRAGITTEIVWRLAERLNTSAQFWMNLQAAHDGVSEA